MYKWGEESLELKGVKINENNYNFMGSELEALSSLLVIFNDKIKGKELTKEEKTKITLMNENIEELNSMIIDYNELGKERRMLTEIMLKTIEIVKKQIIQITEEKEEYDEFKKRLKKIKERNPRKIVSEDFDKNKLIINLIESRKREVWLLWH